MSARVSIIEHMSETVQGSRRMTTADLHALVDDLAILAPPTDDADVIDRIDALERMKAAAAAAQARWRSGSPASVLVPTR